MSALFKRLFLATFLVAAPAHAASDAEEKPVDESVETSVEAEASDSTGEEKPATALRDKDAEEWAKKLRARHHEGDVALGVCGARMTTLMWFYQSSVVDGRDDLQPAYEAIKESRTVLKNEAERRAVEDGVGTSVSVMNEYSAEYWEDLVNAAEKPESFQDAHDELFANVQECLTIFFGERAKTEDIDKIVDAADESNDETKATDTEEEKSD